MLRLCVDDDGAGGWSLQAPEVGSVDARACLQTVEALSDEALVGARSRLNPAAGVMLSAVWAGATGQLALIIHHLAVDGVSWRILLEDLNVAWAQHRSGQPVALPAGGAVPVEPGGRGDAERGVGWFDRSVGVDHSPSRCRRGVVADCAGGPQRRVGPASRWAAGGVAGNRDVVCPVVVGARGIRAPPGRRCPGGRLATGGDDPGRVAGSAGCGGYP